ncbi:DivIVA domain-containing protein [Spiroplasma cantharicola]|uniref:DivIVA domain-containing protein n=1 Tax=Spiroplasma cantharicola TaxID=362837 RepID=A0A0M3SJ58_9MOLU|nr:DivIVA domain-containing protein [Spiroplasma cantharicola]ALD66178.1 DivIVA domain-containing protein [Spiroplasma cantharicola]
MADFIKLTKQEIIDKDFEVEYKGYKVEEVDAFLDMIAEDYKFFEEKNIKKEKEIATLKENINRLSSELTETLATLKLSESQMEALARAGLNSSDLIKRISNLEKERYNK